MSSIGVWTSLGRVALPLHLLVGRPIRMHRAPFTRSLSCTQGSSIPIRQPPRADRFHCPEVARPGRGSEYPEVTGMLDRAPLPAKAAYPGPLEYEVRRMRAIVGGLSFP